MVMSFTNEQVQNLVQQLIEQHYELDEMRREIKELEHKLDLLTRNPAPYVVNPQTLVIECAPLPPRSQRISK